MILSQLTPQDLARAASTCAEFRDRANAMRAHVSRACRGQPALDFSTVASCQSSDDAYRQSVGFSSTAAQLAAVIGKTS